MSTDPRITSSTRPPSALERPEHRLAPPRRRTRLARGLGWAGLGLGIPLVARPDAVARAIGLPDTPRHRTGMIVVGTREILVAGGLLIRPHPAWLWARVGGDVMDLALLGRVSDRLRRAPRAAAAVVGSVAALTAVDLAAAIARSRRGRVLELTATTTIEKPAREVYEFWRRLDTLPAFMAHVEQVRTTGLRSSHWRASAPFGRSVEWDAEITEDVPGERIGWRSVGRADVANDGVVRFVSAPGGRGTEVHVRLRYAMPAGRLGAAVARYFGEEPHQQLDDDLRRFKQVMETGEVVRSDGAPGGKRARAEFPQHPARPLSDREIAEEVRV